MQSVTSLHSSAAQKNVDAECDAPNRASGARNGAFGAVAPDDDALEWVRAVRPAAEVLRHLIE